MSYLLVQTVIVHITDQQLLQNFVVQSLTYTATMILFAAGSMIDTHPIAVLCSSLLLC